MKTRRRNPLTLIHIEVFEVALVRFDKDRCTLATNNLGTPCWDDSLDSRDNTRGSTADNTSFNFIGKKLGRTMPFVNSALTLDALAF